MLPLTLTHIHTQTNKQTHSALPHPDNGWRVWGVKSNETSREQQLSVCGNGCWGRGAGGSQHTSVLVKARATERESCSDSSNEPQNCCQTKLTKKRQQQYF